MSAHMAIPHPPLLDRLPPLRGKVEVGMRLADLTWFRVGGPAEVLFRPEDASDLAAALRALPVDVPVTVIGVGSNLLVRDGGIAGLVVKLGRGFATVEVQGDVIVAGAAASDVNVALNARDAGLAGLEFLRGVPGTIGGGVRMNAGAYGREFKDVLVKAEAVDRAGIMHTVTVDELDLTYRHSGAPADWIFTRVWLRGTPDEPAAIHARMAEISAAREGSQPVKSRTGGSTFANPLPARAWELIDRAGCRGLVIGDAQVSEQHCNFLINRGNASAADLETLGETVRRRVHETSGVELRWEIRRIGKAGAA